MGLSSRRQFLPATQEPVPFAEQTGSVDIVALIDIELGAAQTPEGAIDSANAPQRKTSAAASTAIASRRFSEPPAAA